MLAIEEIRRAVDGVDKPAMGCIVALGGGEFLARQAPGIAGEEAIADQGLRIAVGIGNEIARALDADLDVAEPREMFEGERAGLAATATMSARIVL